jgi:hypothetical protein
MIRLITTTLLFSIVLTNVAFAAGTDVVDCDWCSSQSDFETAASLTAFSNPSGNYDVYVVNVYGEEIWVVNMQVQNPEQFIIGDETFTILDSGPAPAALEKDVFDAMTIQNEEVIIDLSEDPLVEELCPSPVQGNGCTAVRHRIWQDQRVTDWLEATQGSLVQVILRFFDKENLFIVIVLPDGSVQKYEFQNNDSVVPVEGSAVDSEGNPIFGDENTGYVEEPPSGGGLLVQVGESGGSGGGAGGGPGDGCVVYFLTVTRDADGVIIGITLQQVGFC